MMIHNAQSRATDALQQKIRNDFLDCETSAVACASYSGLHQADQEMGMPARRMKPASIQSMNDLWRP